MIEKHIYTTRQYLSDGTEVKFNDMVELGIGETNLPSRRFKEHIGYQGSKSSVGINMTLHFPVVPSLSDTDIHKKLRSLGYFDVKRHSEYEDIKIFNRTEIFSGTSNKTIKGLVNKGDQLSEDLIKKIVEIEDPDVFKNELILKPHQKEAIEFINSRFNVGVTDILLNHKPRSGKSYIMYDFLINNAFGIKNTLLLTQYPILNGQWEKELSNIKGHNINIINCSDLEDNKSVVNIDENRPNLVMISLQDAKGKDDEEVSDNDMVVFLHKQKFNQLKNIEWDLIIFDEVHKGKETQKTDKLLEGLKNKKLIGLSATPTKNIVRGTFTPENVHIYDLISEREYKRIYGRSMYDLPDIRFNLMYCTDIKKRLKYFQDYEEFNFDKFFRIENNQLYYYDDISLFFQWIFTMNEFDGGQLSRIRRTNGYILIFVPNNKCQKLLVDCLKNTGGRFRNYNITYTNSDVNNSKQLLKLVDNLNYENKKSIIFSNRQLTTGITLKKCDIVMFMNEWKNIDEYIQASYRCQSPSTNKDIADVFDFNPSRSFNILYEYIRNSSLKKIYNIDDAIKEFLKCANVNIYEYGEFKQIDFETFKNNIIKNFDFKSSNIFKQVSNFIDLNELSESIKNDMANFGNFSFGKNNSTNEKLNEDAENSGKTHENHKDDNSETVDNEKSDKSDEVIIQNIEYILSKTPLLSYFTNCNRYSLDAVFEFMDNNEDKRNMYLESLLLSTNIDKETIYNSIKKLYNGLSNLARTKIDDFILFFNGKYDSILDNYLQNYDIIMYINEVIKLIDSYIGVSESEKKLLGEVFTPFELINEMLDTLPKDVWTNPHLKWLDPANGIGNFPIVVVGRLMKGLVDFEPDNDKRYKHIMENMIYVCDINPKNMFIFNNLFNPNDDIKLNTHRGSFLDNPFDIVMKDVWGVDKFDIIIGNPPYQKSGEGRAEKLWTKFISKSSNLSLGGYLLFITPNSWLAGSNNIKKGVTGVYKDYFCKYKLIYANIEKCNKYFPTVSVRFSYFLLKNEESNKFTTIWDIKDGKIYFDIREYDFLPPNMNLLQININDKFFNKGENYNVIPLTGGDKLRKQGIDNECDDKNIKTFVRGSNNHIVHYAYFDKIVNPTVSDIKKVILPMSGAEKFMPFVDIIGIPVCISSYIIKLDSKDTLNGSISFFNSKIIKFIFQENRSSGFIQVFVAKKIPKMDLSKVWTDEELYEYFNLTQEEIDLIEKTIKN